MVAVVLLLYLTPANSQINIIKTVKGKVIHANDLDSFLTIKMDSLQVAGLSIAIINDYQIVYNRGLGFTNALTRDSVNSETLFEAASLSKPLFAWFMLEQVEKGIFDLDKPLYQYLPNEEISYDERYKLITGRMVLCHASGFPNWREPGKPLALLFVPGTKYSYSGEGYQYLKRVIKHILQVNDIQLDKLIQQEVVKSLHVPEMRFSWRASFWERKAFGHINGIPTGNGPIGRYEEGYFNAASSLLTQAGDYSRFLIEIMKDTSKAVNVSMLQLQEHMPPAEDGKWRSIGFPYKIANGKVRYYHTGNNHDTRAYCHFYPENGYGIVMLSNCDNFMSSGFAKMILTCLDEEVLY